ncbi:hypothetical protein HMI54_005757 [Coelomomyces lativittatus]|nr:hypothetical protein HMI54_005757 [Coelomomyces lativittatus]KAJ1514538.1 hypothetical protein HMI56_000255 [Coelomomyces lativittatus]
MNSSQFIEQNLSFPLTLPSSVTSQYPIEHALHSSSGSMITSLKDLSRHIRLLFEKNKHFDINELQRHIFSLLQNCELDEKEWRDYAHFNQWTYARNLIDQVHEQFHILLLCWGPNHKSQIHDHNGAHCCMKVLHGNLIETRFDSSTLKPVLITQLSLNQVAYIHDSIGLHCIANPSPSPSVSLHVYFPPIHECLIYHPITMCTSKSICNNYQSNACAGIPQS